MARREQDSRALGANDLPYKETGQNLNICEYKIKTHLRAINTKLGF